MTERRHIAERLTDVLQMQRRVSEAAHAKGLTFIEIAANDEVTRAADALQACWIALERLYTITGQVKLEKPR